MGPRFSLGLGAVFFVAPAVAYLGSDTLPPKRLEDGPHPGAIFHVPIPGRLLDGDGERRRTSYPDGER